MPRVQVISAAQAMKQALISQGAGQSLHWKMGSKACSQPALLSASLSSQPTDRTQSRQEQRCCACPCVVRSVHRASRFPTPPPPPLPRAPRPPSPCVPASPPHPALLRLSSSASDRSAAPHGSLCPRCARQSGPHDRRRLPPGLPKHQIRCVHPGPLSRAPTAGPSDLTPPSSFAPPPRPTLPPLPRQRQGRSRDSRGELSL